MTRLDLRGHYPGLQGIGFTLRFAPRDRETVAKTGRDHIDPAFALWPADPPREEYHAIFYLEPLDERNRLAIGYDMHAEPVRAAAMDEARDAAAPRASGKVQLVQEGTDAHKQAGFLIYSPLYKGKQIPPSVGERRAKLYGYVYAPFRADDLMAGVFRGDPHGGIDFLLYDGTRADAGSLLHDSSVFHGAVARQPRYARSDLITAAGRTWTIRFVTRPGFERSARWLTPLILALGVTVSLAFFAMARSQVKALAAERLAAAELRSSESALREAKDVAEAASRLKDEFLTTISHELRTPLNAILGWSQLLRTAGTTPEDVAQGLEVIERNARAQARLVEDLLDMEQVAAGKMRLDPQPVDLPAVVEAAMECVRPAAEAKGVRLEGAIDPPAGRMRGDPARLQQVFWNLLSNAVKFTGKGGRVRVSLEPTDSRAEVRVADTGEGIKPEFLPRLFDRFTQADGSTTRRHGGLGLGLAIARQLVELHGGTIKAESAGEGKGSTFTVRLPLAAESNRAAPPDESGSADEGSAPELKPLLRGVRVLLVDDDAATLAVAQRTLERCGADVTAAGSAATAIAAFEESLEGRRFDVLASDIAMPDGSGVDLIRQVRDAERRRGGARRVAAVALTAHARAEDREQSFEAGFDLHLTKPIAPQALMDALTLVVRGVEGE